MGRDLLASARCKKLVHPIATRRCPLRILFLIRVYPCSSVVKISFNRVGSSLTSLPVMPAKLSTHVLDTAHGCPASGMQIELWSLADGARKLLKTVRTNSDGRTDSPLLTDEEMKSGEYEILFYVGDYFTAKISSGSKVRFLDKVPVRFGISDTSASYHVPLLCSPWAYSTYRGS